jgi:hypothetical protein
MERCSLWLRAAISEAGGRARSGRRRRDRFVFALRRSVPSPRCEVGRCSSHRQPNHEGRQNTGVLRFLLNNASFAYREVTIGFPDRLFPSLIPAFLSSWTRFLLRSAPFRSSGYGTLPLRPRQTIRLNFCGSPS